MNELISIVVPVYQAQRFIRTTIHCVKAQTYPNWELLLIVDRQSDPSAEEIRLELKEDPDERIRVFFCREGERGAAMARNRGVREAKGTLLAYLDADDLWKPEKLAHMYRFLREKKGVFAFSGYEFADEEGVGTGKIVRVPAKITYQQALSNTTIFTSTVLLDLERLGKEALQMPVIKSEDTALWWRILRSGVTAYGLDENLVSYRRSGTSLSANKIEALRRIWGLYRKAEGLSVPKSCFLFCFWAIRAVARRL